MNEPITQVQDHEGRIGRLEGIAEQINRTLAELHADMRDLRTEMRDLRTTNRWIIGILFGLVGLQITLLLKVLS